MSEAEGEKVRANVQTAPVLAAGHVFYEWRKQLSRDSAIKDKRGAGGHSLPAILLCSQTSPRSSFMNNTLSWLGLNLSVWS